MVDLAMGHIPRSTECMSGSAQKHGTFYS